MDTTNITKELFDLTRKEIELYKFLLKHPGRNASELAQGVGMQRPNAYDLLKNLVSKGLVSYSTDAKIKNYSAAHPNKLREIYEFKKEIVAAKESEVDSFIKSLAQSMVSENKDLKVQFYNGLKGMRTILMEAVEESRKTKKEMLAIRLNEDDLPSLDKTYTERFFRLRKKYKIKSRYLRLKGTKFFNDSLVESRILADAYKSSTGWYIYGDKVSIWLFPKNETIVMLESKEIAEALRSYFEVMWKSAGRT